eukprot:1157659-Pelagomonas_calceolata.AAC.3
MNKKLREGGKQPGTFKASSGWNEAWRSAMPIDVHEPGGVHRSTWYVSIMGAIFQITSCTTVCTLAS